MWIQRNRSKYGASKTTFNNRLYASKGEAGYAQELELRRKSGEIREIYPQYKLSLDVNGYHITNYYVDFMVIMKDGSKELHEYKGMVTDTFRLKWKLTEALYGQEYKMILIK